MKKRKTNDITLKIHSKMAQGKITLQPREFIDIETLCTELKEQGFTADIMDNSKMKLRLPNCTILIAYTGTIQVFGNFNFTKAKSILFRLNTELITKHTINTKPQPKASRLS